MSNEIVVATPVVNYDKALRGLLASLRPQSRRNYKQTVLSFVKFLETGKYAASGVGPSVALQEFLAERSESGLSGRYIAAQRVHLRQFFKWLFREGLLSERDLANVLEIDAPKVQGHKAGNWLTLEQMQAMIDQIDTSTLRGRRDKAIIATFFGCALRRGEICQLTWGHFHRHGDTWVIKNLERKHGKTQPYVSVPSWVVKAIEDYRPRGKDNEKVFVSIDKHGNERNSITGDSLRRLVVAYSEKLGFGVISPHDLRRSSARQLREAGVELSQIQQQLGHSSVETTQRYVSEIFDVESLATALNLRV